MIDIQVDTVATMITEKRVRKFQRYGVDRVFRVFKVFVASDYLAGLDFA